MRTFCKMMIWLLGWNILISKERLNKKSVIVVAPHTSFIDGIIGWLALTAVGIKYRCISAEWLFFFPMKYIMRGVLNAIPCGKKSGNSITVACKALAEEDDMHVVICPEGRLRAVDEWNCGFFIMAKRAKCPIDVVEINYKDKEIEMCCSMAESFVEQCGVEDAMSVLRVAYENSRECAKYPKKFLLPKLKVRK